MSSNNQQVEGVGGNIQGNGNSLYVNSSVTNMLPSRPLTPSAVCELLELFRKCDVVGRELDMNAPMPIDDKLEFNNVKRYTPIFRIHSPEYQTISQAIQDMAHGEDIIKKLATLFYEHCEYDGQKPKVSNNGDLVIDVIKKKLIELIEGSSNFNREETTQECVERFVIGLIEYGVHECKILINENEGLR